jgi:hypothetical protein
MTRIKKFNLFENNNIDLTQETVLNWLKTQYPENWFNSELSDRVYDYIGEEEAEDYDGDYELAYTSLMMGGAIEYDLLEEIRVATMKEFKISDSDQKIEGKSLLDIIHDYFMDTCTWKDSWVFNRRSDEPYKSRFGGDSYNNLKDSFKDLNESIKRKDISEVINDILDNLSNKKELSKSEKQFLDAATKNEVLEITVPNMTGNFWQNMANPHNLGTMWCGKDGVWQLLKTIEDEELEKIEKSGNSDDVFEFKKKKQQEKIAAEFPELKPLLIDFAKIKIENIKKEQEIIKKINKLTSNIKDNDIKYDIKQRIDYALKDLYSLENQFGYILPELKMDDDGEYDII